MSGGHFGMFWGGVLLELSLILDCVDGQLARATGQSSEWGRLLDGIGGYVAYLAVVFGITYSLPEFTGALAVVTLVCIMKAICFDYCKQYFTARVQQGTDGSRADVLKTYQQWSQSQSGILKVYFIICNSSNGCFTDAGPQSMIILWKTSARLRKKF